MMPINRTPNNAVDVGILLQRKSISIAMLRTMTTEELLAENVHLTGYTRFPSLAVLLAFFITGMSESKAAVLLGYKTDDDGRVGRNVAKRMNRIAEEIDHKFYRAFYILRKAGHIGHSLAWVLDPERHKMSLRGRNRRNISVNICKTIVARNGGSRFQAALHTKVPRSTIDFWLNLGYKE